MNLFTEAEQRYKIDSFQLTKLRENLHLSVVQFAMIVGWSSSYQYQLEEGKYLTVSKKTKEEIIAAFKRYNSVVK